jgi:hypothetical protein
MTHRRQRRHGISRPPIIVRTGAGICVSFVIYTSTLNAWSRR